MVAFSPHWTMGGLQGLDLLYQGFTEVPTIDGRTANKEYLASKIKGGMNTIQQITAELRKKIDGEYQLDEAFATRLVVERDQLLAQLDQFSKTAFGGVKDGDVRKELENAFQVLIDAITERNGLIIRYNATIKLILVKKDEQERYEVKERELSRRQVEENDPDLPIITRYVEAIYQASRARVMKLLDILLRSLNFRMVITSDVYDYIFGGSNPVDAVSLDKVPLSLTTTVLRDARDQVQVRRPFLSITWITLTDVSNPPGSIRSIY